ncbi:unnamed protein product [Musa banksii]
MPISRLGFPFSTLKESMIVSRLVSWMYGFHEFFLFYSFDEWKDPSEEALAGGRGMFCILPIAKSMLNVASLSISLAADFVIKALKSPIQLSRQELHANLCSQFHKLALNMQGWNLKLITLGNRRQNAMNSEEVPTN